MAELRSKTGLLRHEDGRVEQARFYYGEGEDPPPDHSRLDPSRHATWLEHDGTVGIRRGTSVSVGATPAYAANYDALDWGN
jgi:hypothetical protein